jgi:hypothetical protein
MDTGSSFVWAFDGTLCDGEQPARGSGSEANWRGVYISGRDYDLITVYVRTGYWRLPRNLILPRSGL